MPIERIGPEEVDRLRNLRRRALADDPDAFATTVDQHDAETPALWRERLASPRSATFIARVSDHDVGLVMGAPFVGRTDACGLFGMWVSPDARRRGLALELVTTLIEWARSAGYPRLILDVGRENAPARRLYARCGFAPTGRQSTLPAPRTHVVEEEFERRL